MSVEAGTGLLTRNSRPSLTFCSFRFTDLPKELRDAIYEYSLESRATFLHTKLGSNNADYHLPTITLCDAENADETSDGVEDGDEQPERMFDYLQIRPSTRDPNAGREVDNRTLILAFKLRMVTTTTFLLLSKTISHEFQQRANALRPHYHDIIRSSIHLHRIVSTCPLFLNICSRSQFVFINHPEVAFSYVKTLPPVVKECVPKILIKPTDVGLNPLTIRMWNKFFEFYRDELEGYFLKQLPRLRYLSIDVSAEDRARYVDTWCL
jgi:hypothetical protein